MAPKFAPGSGSSGFMRSGVLRHGYYEDNKFFRRGESDEGPPIYCESSTSSDELAADCDVPRQSIEPESGSLKRKRTRDVNAGQSEDSTIMNDSTAREGTLREQERDVLHHSRDGETIIGDESPSERHDQRRQERTVQSAAFTTPEPTQNQQEQTLVAQPASPGPKVPSSSTVRKNSLSSPDIRKAGTMAEGIAVLAAFGQHDDGSRVDWQGLMDERERNKKAGQKRQRSKKEINESLPALLRTRRHEEQRNFKKQKTQNLTDEEMARELHEELNGSVLHRPSNEIPFGAVHRSNGAERSGNMGTRPSTVGGFLVISSDRDSSVEVITEPENLKKSLKPTSPSQSLSKGMNINSATPSKLSTQDSSSDQLFVSPQISTSNRKRILSRAHGSGPHGSGPHGMFSSLPPSTGKPQRMESSPFSSGPRIARPIFNKSAQFQENTPEKNSLPDEKEASTLKKGNSLPTNGTYKEPRNLSMPMSDSNRRKSSDGKKRTNSGFTMMDNPRYAMRSLSINDESPLQRKSDNSRKRPRILRSTSGTPEIIRGAGKYLNGAEANEGGKVMSEGTNDNVSVSDEREQHVTRTSNMITSVARNRPPPTWSTHIRSIWEASPGEEVKLLKTVDVKMEMPQKTDTVLPSSVQVIELSD